MEIIKNKTILRRYSKYKYSGIDWLGNIPEHWKLIRGNYVFQIVDERSKKGEEELVKRGMDEEWTHKIKDIGEENIKAKSEELKERFTLRTWESNGVEVIKKCLGNVADENSVKFNYISAPEYEITKESRDLSEGEEILKKSIKDLKEELKNKDAEVQALFE